MTKRNTDFQDGNTIPFTQYLRPDGRATPVWIDTGSDGIDQDVVAKAREIVDASARRAA